MPRVLFVALDLGWHASVARTATSTAVDHVLASLPCRPIGRPGSATEVRAYPILGYCQPWRCGWPVEKSIYSAEYRRLCVVLRELRHEAGLTQVQVATRLNVPQSFVSKYESGERRLDLIELRHVAHALQTSVEDVLQRLDRPR